MAVANGVKRGAVWNKPYPGSNKPLYFSTYVNYGTGQGGRGLNPSQVDTYLMYQRPGALGINEWVTSAKLGIDGKWIPLKESESQVLYAGETLQPTGSTSNNYILGDAARKDLSAGGTGSLRYQAINNSKVLLRNTSGVSVEEVDRAYDVNNNITAPGQSPTPSIVGDAVTADQATPTVAPATQPSGGVLTEEQLEQAQKAKARTGYDILLKYPLTIDDKVQDYLKFQMIQYRPRGLGEGNTNLNLGVLPDRPIINTSDTKNILGSVLLPIPGNISDSNTVGWGDDRMDALATAMVTGATAAITQGGKGISSTLSKMQQTASSDKTGLQQAVLGYFTQQATGTNPLARLYGIVANPNLELLFTGPDLRNFSFTFRLSPRSKDEAIQIKKIIRFFKQGMSVKKTEGQLFLKTPHTFQLSYWNTRQREHPYLNKFKECALKSFSVNYAPDGSYMTFNGEPSMTAYEITMQFSELEPIFDSDYPNDEDATIGY